MEELCITIPCKVDKPDNIAPIYVFDGEDSTGAAKCHWECAYCRRPFERRKPCTRHMGLVMNIPASCPKLAEQDKKRRKKPVETEDLSYALGMIREREKMNRQTE